jgi:hypothetical protein
VAGVQKKQKAGFIGPAPPQAAAYISGAFKSASPFVGQHHTEGIARFQSSSGGFAGADAQHPANRGTVSAPTAAANPVAAQTVSTSRVCAERNGQNRTTIPKLGMSVEELIAWAWENRRSDILARFGIYVTFGL